MNQIPKTLTLDTDSFCTSYQELRSPLTVIRMYVEAIEDGMFENNDQIFMKLKEKFSAIELLMDEMTKGKVVSKQLLLVQVIEAKMVKDNYFSFLHILSTFVY